MHKDSGELGNLRPAEGSVKNRKRIGRGRGSGHGDTATKGNKGAQSRSGYKARARFEGGQMPLQRKLPKRGFNVPDRTVYREINLNCLARFDSEIANPETLRAAGLVSGKGPIVILGRKGPAEVTLKVKELSVHRITATARAAVEAVGGKITLLPLDPFDLRIKRGPKPKPKLKKAKKA